jgi:hypothetical protein
MRYGARSGKWQGAAQPQLPYLGAVEYGVRLTGISVSDQTLDKAASMEVFTFSLSGYGSGGYQT